LLRQLLLLALPLRLLLFELLLELLGLLLLALELAARLCRRAKIGRHEEWPVVARAETRGHQVVGLSLGGRLRRRADVLLAEVERQKRDDEGQENRGCRGKCEPGVGGNHTRPPAPEASIGWLWLRTEKRGQPQGLEPLPDDRKDCGQQRDRREHGGCHGEGRRVPERGDERDPRDDEREQRDHYGAAGEHDRGSGGRDRHCNRLVQSQALAPLGAVPADEEERVVDADPEPDHRGEGWRDRRDCEEVAHEPDQRQADEEADDGGDERQAHGHERAEGEREDDHRCDEADDLAALGSRLRELGPDGPASRDLHPSVLSRRSRVEDLLRELVRQLVPAHVEQNRDERRLLVLADLRGALLAERIRSTCNVRQFHDRLVGSLDRLLRLRVGDLARVDVEDDRAAPVLLRREALGEQVGGGLAVGAGKAEIVAGVGPERSDQQDERSGRDDPRADHNPLSVGGEPAEPIQETRHRDRDLSSPFRRVYSAPRGSKEGRRVRAAAPR
jgi:hypothetical protein